MSLGYWQEHIADTPRVHAYAPLAHTAFRAVSRHGSERYMGDSPWCVSQHAPTARWRGLSAAPIRPTRRPIAARYGLFPPAIGRRPIRVRCIIIIFQADATLLGHSHSLDLLIFDTIQQLYDNQFLPHILFHT